MNFRRALPLAALVFSTTPTFGQGTVKMVPLAKNPPKAMMSATPLGAKAGSDVLHLAVSLGFRDPAGAQSFVDSVSDPKSPNYRHFITPDEVGRRFGLPQSEIAKVANYLRAQGMKLKLVGKNRLSIVVDATVNQAQAAFSTSFQQYSVAKQSKFDNGQRFSFTTPPQLPSSFAFNVVDICGLENFTRPKQRNLSPAQLQGLYTVAQLSAKGDLGQGRTIAISNWDGFRITNEVLECQGFSLPVPAGGAGTNITVETVDGGDGIRAIG